jgi:hypothetical protein
MFHKRDDYTHEKDEKESKELTRERLGYPGLRSGVGKAMEKGEEERKRL